MALTPLEIQKTRFQVVRKGYDADEVEEFLSLMAEELTARLADLDRLERENRYFQQRLQEAEERERQLQETLVRAKKVSDEMIANTQREAQLVLREAEMTADKIVSQALEQAHHIEQKIQELRVMRKDLQIKLKGTLELFSQILESEREDERTTATVHTLPPGRARRQA